MKNKIIGIILAILIFIAGFIAGWLCCTLINSDQPDGGEEDIDKVDPIPQHIHTSEGEWQSDGEGHWWLCSCGEIIGRSAHVGGEATYERGALCEICGAEYGEPAEKPHTHQAEGEWQTDGDSHWRTCSCGEVMDKAAHKGGKATTEKKAECEVCGTPYGDLAEDEEPVHTHKAEGEWLSDGNNHWQTCSCGEIMNKATHKGGTATTDKKAECGVCGAEYGDYVKEEEPLHTHSFGDWIADGESHWKACSCGEIKDKASHSGGAATAEKRAVCTACGEEYGDLAEPEHIHKAEEKWYSDLEDHWRICSCGEIMDIEGHRGGEATYEKQAQCEVCGKEYGEVLEKPHTHESEGSWVTDEESHWKVCSCGEIMDKSAHTGGTATTTQKAVCEICGVEYGELLEPSGGNSSDDSDPDGGWGGGRV